MAETRVLSGSHGGSILYGGGSQRQGCPSLLEGIVKLNFFGTRAKGKIIEASRASNNSVRVV